jgi:hypothetical protein
MTKADIFGFETRRPSVLSFIKSVGNRWQRSNVPKFSKTTDGAIATNRVRVLFGAPKYRHIHGMKLLPQREHSA